MEEDQRRQLDRRVAAHWTVHSDGNVPARTGDGSIHNRRYRLRRREKDCPAAFELSAGLLDRHGMRRGQIHPGHGVHHGLDLRVQQTHNRLQEWVRIGTEPVQRWCVRLAEPAAQS